MAPAYAECWDPTGARHGIPTYPWQMAPDGYATVRQLRALGLRPGGQPVALQTMLLRRHRPPLVAYFYRIDRALPVRPMTSRKWGALALAMLARRTCPSCGLDAGYCIPPTLGTCVTCANHPPQEVA